MHPGNAPDTQTIIDTAIDAAGNAEQAGVENDLQAIVADEGYHSTKVVTLATDVGMRAYIPERASPIQRRWTDKDPAEQRGVYNARRRTQSERGKQLSRLRSELTERSFAHVCNTGGAASGTSTIPSTCRPTAAARPTRRSVTPSSVLVL